MATVRVTRRGGIEHGSVHLEHGTEFDLPEHRAETLVRIGWCELVDDESGDDEAAIVPDEEDDVDPDEGESPAS